MDRKLMKVLSLPREERVGAVEAMVVAPAAIGPIVTPTVSAIPTQKDPRDALLDELTLLVAQALEGAFPKTGEGVEVKPGVRCIRTFAPGRVIGRALESQGGRPVTTFNRTILYWEWPDEGIRASLVPEGVRICDVHRDIAGGITTAPSM